MFTCLIFTFSQNVELKVLLATPLFDVLCRNIPTKTVESGFYARFYVNLGIDRCFCYSIFAKVID